MTRKMTLIAAVLAVALSAAAGSAVAGANQGAHVSASKTISVRDSYFSPKSLSVSKGTTLRFVWGGRLPHNLVGPGANYGARVRGSVSVRATRSGSYICTIHRGMKISVKVR
jgi:plastocyanin